MLLPGCSPSSERAIRAQHPEVLSGNEPPFTGTPVRSSLSVNLVSRRVLKGRSDSNRSFRRAEPFGCLANFLPQIHDVASVSVFGVRRNDNEKEQSTINENVPTRFRQARARE